MLRGAGLLDAFRFIVSAGETEHTKPAPDPYLRAAELHGVPPAACVAIEDSHWGLLSARAAGMRTIAITHTYPRESLTEADVVVDSLDEITVEFISKLSRKPRSRKPKAGSRKPEAGSRKLEAGSWQSAVSAARRSQPLAGADRYLHPAFRRRVGAIVGRVEQAERVIGAVEVQVVDARGGAFEIEVAAA